MIARCIPTSKYVNEGEVPDGRARQLGYESQHDQTRQPGIGRTDDPFREPDHEGDEQGYHEQQPHVAAPHHDPYDKESRGYPDDPQRKVAGLAPRGLLGMDIHRASSSYIAS